MKCVCVEGHTGPKGNGKMRRYKANVVYDISKAQLKEFKDFFVQGVIDSEPVVQSISLKDAGQLGEVKSSEELKNFKYTDLRDLAVASGITIPGDVKSKDGIIGLLKPIFDK